MPIIVLDAGVIQQIDTPMRLYEQRANVFVAGFFGSPAMSFFRGTLSHDASHLVQDGATVALGDLVAVRPALAGDAGRDIALGLRPEDLHLAADDARRGVGPGLAARLEYVEPVGNEVLLNLRFADRDRVARVPPRPLPEPGSTVSLGFLPARVDAFDAQSGLRIDAVDAPSLPLRP